MSTIASSATSVLIAHGAAMELLPRRDRVRTLFDPRRLPPGLRALFLLVDEWAIADDVERSMKVENASAEGLGQLVRAVQSVDQDALYGWLAGPEASSPTPSEEYLAITCLTMAADEARVMLTKDR